MSRYIDAEALDNRIKAEWAKQEDDKGYGLAHFFVETQPTADVAPVVHAHWIDSPNIMECVVCSNCFSDDLSAQVVAPPPADYKFCPSCGAQMDEKVKQ